MTIEFGLVAGVAVLAGAIGHANITDRDVDGRRFWEFLAQSLAAIATAVILLELIVFPVVKIR